MSTVEKTMEKVSKFFSTTKKGEIHELKEQLASNKEEKRVEAVKQVIAEMTDGKDVSVLFTDVLNCMQTHNLELKKLVYLYVMNYAKSNPDRAILAVNTFHKDASDPNPLIRALAVRTMSCIRVEQITEYLTQPLQMCLKDSDPYVRKTAAVAVAKLYDLNPEAVESQGFLDTLRELLADSNPMVVSNAVAVLSEISEISTKEVFKVDGAILSRLLSALNECTEWGQVFILDSLAKFQPRDYKDAESICERVSIRFNHSNSAVVLSAVKVVLLCLPFLTNQELRRGYVKKLCPPLVTLLSSGKEPEIQYVALRNINLIVQKEPEILQHEVKIFFCKYNDPIYVKLEKLELMIMLASDKNVDMVLSEFKEYATMVDVEFVRKSVRAIGRCAVKLPDAADRCVQVLLDLIQTKVNYVVQEAVVVIKDIFRKYPNKYESIIATLCENLETLDEPEAKASMIWIIGEYADRIDNADELLDRFLEGFGDESAQVQLALLTAVVKLFLRKPDNNQAMVQAVLDKTTKECDNPDLRDRGFMYWRLLSADPEAAKAVVLADRPLIKDTSAALDPDLLALLVENLGTLASVFHKPPTTFVSKIRADRRLQRISSLDDDDEDADADENIASDTTTPTATTTTTTTGNIIDLLGDSVPTAGTSTTATATTAAAAPAASHTIMDDLLGLSVPTAAAAPAAAAGISNSNNNNGMADIFGNVAPAATAGPTSDKPLLLDAEKGRGMEVHGLFARRDKQVFFDLTFINRGADVLSQFAIQFNKNNFGVTAPQQIPIASLAPNQAADASLPVSMQGVTTPGPLNPTIQIAIRNSTGQIYFFVTQLPAECFFAQTAPIDQASFLAAWEGLPAAAQAATNVPLRKVTNISALNTALASVAIATVGIAGQTVLTYMKLANGTACLCEITVNGPTRSCQVVCRSADNTLASSVLQLISSLL